MYNPEIMTTDAQSQYDDATRPLRRAIRMGAVALAAVILVSLALWGVIAGISGIWAVLIGGAIGGGFVLLTVLSTLVTSGTSPATTGAVVLGSWLVKIIVLIVVLWAIKDLQFYHRIAMVVTTIAALVVVLTAEVWAVMTTKVTTINPD